MDPFEKGGRYRSNINNNKFQSDLLHYGKQNHHVILVGGPYLVFHQFDLVKVFSHEKPHYDIDGVQVSCFTQAVLFRNVEYY